MPLAIDNHHRISVLDDNLIRVQFCPDAQPRLDRTWAVVGADGDVPHAGRLRDDTSPFPCPAFDTVQVDDSMLAIKTKKLSLTVNTREFGIAWHTTDGRAFAADIPHRAYRTQGRRVYHYLRRDEREIYLGFGEKSGALDKHGRRIRMQNFDALGYNAETSDPLYKHFPFYITYHPDLKLAYGIFYDNFAHSVFDMGQEIDAYHGYYRYYQADDGDIDYYLMLGDSIAEVVQRFAGLTGHMMLPPRWSLGFLGSTMLYTELPDAQNQLKQFADLCRRHDIPCDMFHLSSGYTTGADGSRYVFTWNRHKIPDPPQMVQGFHTHGIRLCANIKPYLLTSHPAYDDVAQQGGFITTPSGDHPQTEILWSGGAFESAEGAYVDFTSAAGVHWWQQNATAQLLDVGIDSLWNDNNEYEIWDDDALCDGFGDPIRLGMMRPIQTLLMTRASYDAQSQHNHEERPFVLCRSGMPGIQRYAQTWSGDNATSWHTLQWNIPMGLGMSLSGAPNTGHDVGGFFGKKPDPELFLRWIQAGIFQPRFTIHSYNTDGTVNEPWMYPEILPLVRAAMRFRYQLIPYLYTLLVDAHRHGTPITRPLIYHHEDDPHCHQQNFSFLLGEHLLVAPVYQPEARTWQVYLPDGVRWCDFYTGTWHDGGQTVTVDAPLEHIPLFVKAGGVIPMGKAMPFVGAQADDQRLAYVFPDEIGSYQTSWVEDDGISWDYQRGIQTEVTLNIEATAQNLHLSVSKNGDYALPYHTLSVILPPNEQRPVIGDILKSTGGDRRQVEITL